MKGLTVYVVLHEWGYDGGCSVHGIYLNQAEAREYCDTQPQREHEFFSVEEWEIK